MKIGILTASRTDNNGTDLQAMAMLNLFNRIGAKDVELIDYECEKLESSKHLLNIRSLRSIVYYPLTLCLHYKHKLFRQKYFRKSLNKYNKETIISAKYDKIVVGSDQIWNLSITGDDLTFFLPFNIPGMKKYSYAASIGRDDIQSWEIEYQLSNRLRDFQTVSVREESAVKTLASIGIDARYDLDPILMGSIEDWRLFIKNNRKKKYVLLYFLDSSPAWLDAKRYAHSKGFEVINICTTLKCYSGIKTHRCVGIEEWLNFVANAEIIYTSSYHCVSFAILFNKPFCLVPKESSIQSNSRMLDLVRRLALDKCVYSESYDHSMVINWSLVNEKLKYLRTSSEQYVKTIIKD